MSKLMEALSQGKQSAGLEVALKLYAGDLPAVSRHHSSSSIWRCAYAGTCENHIV